MKKIAVLVSCYNSGQWLENRLDNIYRSDIVDDLEVVVANANSPDERDHTIPQKYPCKYIKLNERLDLYSTWNLMIKESNSKYITNANTDDIVSPTCYSTLSNILDAVDNCGCAYPSWHTTALENQKWSELREVDWNGGQPGHFTGNPDTGSAGHFPMWRRELHDKVGYFDPTYTALSDLVHWCKVYYFTKYDFIWTREALGCYLWRHGQNLWNVNISPAQWERFHGLLAQIRQNSSRN